MEKRIENLLLTVILLTALGLSLFGIQMGVPSRWYVDEVYATSLRILGERSLMPALTSSLNPGAYPIALAVFQIPYLLILKLSGYPMELAAASASLSWTQMALDYPGLASGIIIWSRLFSVLLGVSSCYILYKLGKRMYHPRVGLYSALVLATSMDFSGTNHFAIPTSLVSFLTLFSFYFVVEFYDSGFNTRFIKLAALTAGLCFSTKLNGLIAILPLGIVLWFTDRRRLIFFIRTSLCYLILGVILGNPIVLIHPIESFKRYGYLLNYYLIDIEPATMGQIEHYNFFTRGLGLANYLIQITYGIGIPYALLALAGIAIHFSNRKNGPFHRWLLGLFLLSYWFIISLTQYGVNNAPAKASVLLTPFIALLAGTGLEQLLGSKQWGQWKWLKAALAASALCYSFWYCLSADWVFIKKDTRYQVTQWIHENIPKESTVEFLFEINRAASEELFKNYQILHAGVNARESKGISPFKNMMEKSVYYFNHREAGPEGKYLVLTFDSFTDIPIIENAPPDTLMGKCPVIQGLLKGKYPYRLAKKFIPSNYKIESRWFPGVLVPLSFWKNPIPNMGYISPIVYIYERTSA